MGAANRSLEHYCVTVFQITLVRSCWRESPASRPSTELICEQIKEMLRTAGQTNHMDHEFAILEEHTISLEQEVIREKSQRTNPLPKAV